MGKDYKPVSRAIRRHLHQKEQEKIDAGKIRDAENDPEAELEEESKEEQN